MGNLSEDGCTLLREAKRLRDRFGTSKSPTFGWWLFSVALALLDRDLSQDAYETMIETCGHNRDRLGGAFRRQLLEVYAPPAEGDETNEDRDIRLGLGIDGLRKKNRFHCPKGYPTGHKMPLLMDRMEEMGFDETFLKGIGLKRKGVNQNRAPPRNG